MDLKSDNDRLQRQVGAFSLADGQCENLASDAELARASVLTYKGHLDESDKTFDELLKENLYLSGMLKQKETQMEEAEKRWRQQFNEAMRRATMDSDDEDEEDEDDDDDEDQNDEGKMGVRAKKGNRGRVSLYPDMLPKVIAKDSPSVEVDERCDE